MYLQYEFLLSSWDFFQADQTGAGSLSMGARQLKVRQI